MNVTMKQFSEKLRNLGFVITDKSAITSMWLTFRDTDNGHIAAIVLDGCPGVGKTFLAEKSADAMDAEVIFFQFYRGAGKEELLYDLDVAKIVQGMSGNYVPENFKDIVSLGVLPKAAHLSNEKKVVLILDEMDKSHPSTDAMLLDFLQSGRINIPHIGEIKANTANLVVVFTKNDERSLSEPLLRRCRPVHIEFPSFDVEVKMIRDESHCPLEMAKALVTFAKKVREADLTKIPSTPELIRLAKDITLLYEEGEKDMIGTIVMNTLYSDLDDVPKSFQVNNVSGIFSAILEKGEKS